MRKIQRQHLRGNFFCCHFTATPFAWLSIKVWTYIIFVADTTDFVRGAKFLMWSNLMVMWNKIASQDKQSQMTKLLVVWSSFGMWSSDKLLLIQNYVCCLVHFVAIYALLCAAQFNPKILFVEHKWQIWCLRLDSPSHIHLWKWLISGWNQLLRWLARSGFVEIYYIVRQSSEIW